MSSRKITKKVVVKPVPTKKKKPELATWLATSATGYSAIVMHDATAKQVAIKFESCHGCAPRYVFKVSASYVVEVATKHVFTEI